MCGEDLGKVISSDPRYRNDASQQTRLKHMLASCSDKHRVFERLWDGRACSQSGMQVYQTMLRDGSFADVARGGRCERRDCPGVPLLRAHWSQSVPDGHDGKAEGMGRTSGAAARAQRPRPVDFSGSEWESDSSGVRSAREHMEHMRHFIDDAFARGRMRRENEDQDGRPNESEEEWQRERDREEEQRELPKIIARRREREGRKWVSKWNRWFSSPEPAREEGRWGRSCGQGSPFWKRNKTAQCYRCIQIGG